MALPPNHGKTSEQIADEFEKLIDAQIEKQNKRIISKGSYVHLTLNPFPSAEIIAILKQRYTKVGWSDLKITYGGGRDDTEYLLLTY